MLVKGVYMSITPVSINNVAFKSQKIQQAPKAQKPTLVDRINENNRAVLKYSPATIGVVNGVCWAAVGMTFDKLTAKLLNRPSGTKSSMIINGIIGGVMGIWAYSQAKKLQKNANA